MAIITISRGSFSRGKEVAEKLAAKLGYECVSREILLEASEEFNIPEMRLTKALHDSPSIFNKFNQGKLRYMTYYKYALLKHIQNDNVVYHGLAGHYFLKDIPHVFKVRVLANIEDRVKELIDRDGFSEHEALGTIKKDDIERRKWGLQLYGIDTWDSRLYDMVINIHKLQVDDAVNILYRAAKKPVFQTTEGTKKRVNEIMLEAKIHSIMIDYSLIVEVKVKNGEAFLSNVGDVLKHDEAIRSRIEKIVSDIDGINKVTFLDKTSENQGHVNPFYNIGS